MISKLIIRFRSKFQFQIPLQFYKTVLQVINIKLVMAVVKNFEKYHHLFILHILVTILFFSKLRFKHTEYKDILT